MLVIGYGNPMRSDDGVAGVVLRRLEEHHIPNLTLKSVHQLHLELLEEACGHDGVILVDACETGEDVSFEKVGVDPSAGMASSHHLSPQLFLHLARIIYNRTFPLYLCSIRGESFEMGETLSPRVLARVDEAVALIKKFIVEGPPDA
ncbi:MAG: hydrogenase maturation protease [Candidatus Omnitrophota bacterium]|nr:hydrogenase maturation protease [Candidatus Omnitrophota bacterium]MDZ4241414.1 hydrogenase maturation protease [Candidatus Omnitrophota bacterium]